MPREGINLLPVLEVENPDLQALLVKSKDSQVAVALHGAPRLVLSHVFRNLSRNRRVEVAEKIKEMKSVDMNSVNAARRALFGTVLEMHPDALAAMQKKGEPKPVESQPATEEEFREYLGELEQKNAAYGGIQSEIRQRAIRSMIRSWLRFPDENDD